MTTPTDFNLDVWGAKLAGIAGALVSMNFLQGTWPARLFTAFCGAVLSFYAAAHIARVISIPEGLAGFLLGMFGMAIASRCWEWIQAAPIAEFWQIVLDRIRRRADRSEK